MFNRTANAVDTYHVMDKLTVKPGYVGALIEDLVMVIKDGCKILTHYTKDLIILE
ncbi:hypothetical protein [Clostridium sp.]|uniref:hypothetical protein n=1 Tax=Clostridium sp. TaxID=1506 RepID=UPI003D6D8092